MHLGLTSFILLYSHEIFPFLLTHLTVLFFFIKEASAHELSPF